VKSIRMRAGIRVLRIVAKYVELQLSCHVFLL
jgi:hypothetical protein